jgi:hypothetical protein
MSARESRMTVYTDTLPGLLNLDLGRYEGNNAKMFQRKEEKAMLSVGRVLCR